MNGWHPPCVPRYSINLSARSIAVLKAHWSDIADRVPEILEPKQ